MRGEMVVVRGGNNHLVIISKRGRGGCGYYYIQVYIGIVKGKA